jgi:hypothetical protein
MVAQTELIFWFLKNAGLLDIKIEHLGWIRNLIPTLTDVTVQLKFGGKIWYGWGSDESEDIALTKALAEVAERLVMQERGFLTSNGIAAHISAQDASIAAVNELRERDLFLCHFYSNTSFAEAKLTDDFGLTGVREWFKNYGVSFHLYHLGPNGFLAVLDGREAMYPFGYVMGAALKVGSVASARSAAIEAARSGYWLLEDPGRILPLSMKQFLNLERPKFKDHGRLALNPDYAKKISHLFGNPSAMMAQSNEDIEFNLEQFRLQAPEFNDCPLYFARASSDKLQNLFLGQPTDMNLNLKRLSSFRGQTLNWQDLLLLPHPLD